MEPTSAAAAGWGRLVARHRVWVLAAWAVLALVAAVFNGQTARLLSPSGFSADTPASRAQDLLRQNFPERRYAVLYAVLQAPPGGAADPAFLAQVEAWRSEIDRDAGPADHVITVTPPGRDGRTIAVIASSDADPDRWLPAAREVRAARHAGPGHVYLGGIGAVYDTFLTDSEGDLAASERVSIPVAAVLLLLIFGGLAAVGLPVATGSATVVTCIALLGLAARHHTVSVFALNVTTAVGLGIGIDYSLLVVNRFREELRRDGAADVETAVARTVGSAGLATLVSGGTAVIGFGALLLSQLNVLWSIGLGGALVVAVGVLASLTLIPALLAFAGRRVDALALPFLGHTSTARFWHALAATVMQRPWAWIAVAGAVVLVIGAPALQLNPGVIGAESLPSSDPSRTADRLLGEQLGFPAHSPIEVVVEGGGDAELAAVHDYLAGVPGGGGVTDATVVPPALESQYRHGTVAVFDLTQVQADNDPATRALLARLRAHRWPAGVKARLTGEAAAYDDFLRLLNGEFPRVVGSVLLLTLLLLGVAFRSAVLPLKAVAMNLFSIAAALGVLTYVFQEGHFSDVLGFHAVGFVDAIEPLIIFAALFGLSMDYEVFLLSRIREEWWRSGDNTGAVAAGMERTGQIITSAALVMVVVFAALTLSQLAVDKALGLTFGVAILLDATVIRLLLVPAFMRVLGDWNWWPARRPSAAPARPEAAA